MGRQRRARRRARRPLPRLTGAAIALGVPLNFGIADFFTRHLKAVFEEIHRVDRWIALAALVVAACWIWTPFRRRAERELARAATAQPSPTV